MTIPLDLYYWPTPNGHKVTMLLEELSLPYQIVPINIGRGDQFEESFLRIAPNNRMPALVDHNPVDGDGPLSIFESGAILQYLAEKEGAFIGGSPRERTEIMQWLFWQMGGLGPMAGQAHHFRHYAPESIDYGINRYTDEVNRLYGVMNKRLADREFLAGDYSIADMAAYPWVKPYKRQGQDLADFPNLNRWFGAIHDRPATIAAYEKAETVSNGNKSMDDAAKQVLFGQRARD